MTVVGKKTTSIVVIGGGAYGTAMAHHLAERGHEVTLWAREPEVVADIQERHENRLFLPSLPLSNHLKAEPDLRKAIVGKEIVVVAVPTQYVRETLSSIGGWIEGARAIVSTSKGIEASTLNLLTSVYEEVLPGFSQRVVYLSGPSFARELALGHPGAVAIASEEKGVGGWIQEAFQSDTFFLDWTDDTLGVALGGAVKNVIAIACGLAEGLGFGHSTRAMFITRGLQEMVTLGEKLGARRETFHGLAGVGDLIVTCMGELSRNKRLGLELAQGKSLEEIRAGRSEVAEGFPTAQAVHNLSQKLKLQLPLCERTYRILYEKLPPRQILS